MDKFVYSSVEDYFNALEYSGYMSRKKSESLLVLLFYYNLIYNDFRGRVSEKYYHIIEQALNCLYGTNCLIPYPDYLKMGKLKLGEMAEVISRVARTEDRLDVVENTKVVKKDTTVTTINSLDLTDVIVPEGDENT